MNKKTSILLIYTGGTIGMVQDYDTGVLHPFDLGKIYDAVPTLRKLDYIIDSYTFENIIDSSDMKPEYWIKLAEIIEENYNKYDGFVVLHGTDTMSYTASALSFMFENLSKPIVLTGSQLPLGMIRTDGEENIISAIEIAANKQPLIPEVCIYFGDKLFRANRTTKMSSEYFDAFHSGNYPSLAKTGIRINYKENLARKPNEEPLKVYKKLDNNIAILKLYPGISSKAVHAVLSIEGLKAVVMETYGAGNAPTDEWFLQELKRAIQKGIIIYNVTQCKSGSVNMKMYEAGSGMRKIGVLSGFDITTESAVAKLMFLLGNYSNRDEITELLETSLRGELTK